MSTAISSLCALALSTAAAEEPRFAAPVLLVAEGEPLGRELLYPSPALFDVDGDGAAELVVGDLWGRLHVAERRPDQGPYAWSATTPLVAADGEELKFSNW